MRVVWCTGATVVMETTGQLLPEQAPQASKLRDAPQPVTHTGAAVTTMQVIRKHRARRQSTWCALFQGSHTVIPGRGKGM